MQSNYINVSGRSLSLKGGRTLVPFASVTLEHDDYDQKYVQRGFLLERPEKKAATAAAPATKEPVTGDASGSKKKTTVKKESDS